MMQHLFLCILISLNPAYSQTFQDINTTAITNDASPSSSCAWGDYNNDNFLDLYVVNGEANYNNFFYKNNKDGTFEKVAFDETTIKSTNSFGVNWIDYNNDGFLDLYISNADYAARYGAKNFLFKNNGNATFTQITTGDLVNDLVGSYCSAWADYDNDGLLDVYVSNTYGKGVLYKNLGADAFKRISDIEPTQLDYAVISCSWADFDNDNYVDLLLLTNGDTRRSCALFKNLKDGTFKRIQGIGLDFIDDNSWVQRNVRSASWGDFNNDGLLDIAINTIDEQNNKKLYKNNGNGTYSKVVLPYISTNYDNFGQGSVFADFDNDGYLDIFYSDQQNALFKNLGNGNFILSQESTYKKLSKNILRYSVSAIDYDNNGLIDLYISNRFDTDRSVMNNTLLKNVTDNCNTWANIDLIGKTSNRDGIGAKLKLYTSSVPYFQYREINANSGGGYCTESGLNATFGLGNAKKIDSLLIYWPSGKTCRLQDITQINQLIAINEDCEIVEKYNPDTSKVIISKNTFDKDCPRITTSLKALSNSGTIWFKKTSPLITLSQNSVLEISDSSTTYIATNNCKTKVDSITIKTDTPKQLSINRMVTKGCDKRLSSLAFESQIYNPVWYDLNNIGIQSTGPIYNVPENLSLPTIIKAVNGCKDSSFVKIDTIYYGKITAPNVITPNDDNINEYFEITNPLNDIIEIDIFSRWGVKVFTDENYKDNWNAKDLTDGIYYYYFKNKSGECQQKGWIQVLR